MDFFYYKTLDLHLIQMDLAHLGQLFPLDFSDQKRLNTGRKRTCFMYFSTDF
jgi:hypothetical protein